MAQASQQEQSLAEGFLQVIDMARKAFAEQPAPAPGAGPQAPAASLAELAKEAALGLQALQQHKATQQARQTEYANLSVFLKQLQAQEGLLGLQPAAPGGWLQYAPLAGLAVAGAVGGLKLGQAHADNLRHIKLQPCPMYFCGSVADLQALYKLAVSDRAWTWRTLSRINQPTNAIVYRGEAHIPENASAWIETDTYRIVFMNKVQGTERIMCPSEEQDSGVFTWFSA